MLGTCEHCGQTFACSLIHDGFNESCHAYCERCGTTAVIDTNYRDREAEGLPRHRGITAAGEDLLRPCDCGGRFVATGSPRCPDCRAELSALAAASWIEAQSPGAARGWRWQRNWTGGYALVIEGRLVANRLVEPDS